MSLKYATFLDYAAEARILEKMVGNGVFGIRIYKSILLILY
jgi:hypothetical protein